MGISRGLLPLSWNIEKSVFQLPWIKSYLEAILSRNNLEPECIGRKSETKIQFVKTSDMGQPYKYIKVFFENRKKKGKTENSFLKYLGVK